MKTLICIVFSIALFVIGIAYGAPPKVAFEIIMDDSGVLSEAEQAATYKTLLLSYLRDLRKKRRYAKARIELISSSYGRAMWIGTPADLKSAARSQAFIEAMTTRPKHCNNLPAAFAELGTNLKLLANEGFEEIHVFIFSSLIHTPTPCEDTQKIKLPQVPPPVDVNAILTSSKAVRSVSLYWVNPFQKSPWLARLQKTADWLKAKDGRFTLLDITHTEGQMRDSLKEVAL